MKIVFKYLKDNKESLIERSFNANTSFNDENIMMVLKADDNRISVFVDTKKEITVLDAYVEVDQEYKKDDRIFFNGYSDWTFSYEDTIDTRNPGINRMPFKFYTVDKLHLDRYGDTHFVKYADKKGINHGWTYLYIRNHDKYKLFGSLNDDFAFTRFEVNTNKNKLYIRPDIASFTSDKGFTLLDVVTLEGTEKEVFDKWFEEMNIEKPKCKPIVGYTSWYNHYQNINDEIIKKDFKGIEKLPNNIDVFQIDDGYETFVGDWLNVDHEKFKDGLKPTVEAIHEKGYKAGLWLAPFVAEEKSEVYKKHQDWFVKDKNGGPLKCGCNWSSFYALDIYNEDVVAYLKEVFKTVFEVWNFDLVKLDFLYAACVYNRKDKPRGQIMSDGMKLLRELCGDKLILGCGVPLASAFGRVDYCRIGCDVSLVYDDVFYMQWIHPERNSTKRTMIDSIFRRHLDGRAFYNDPDVFILRDENVKLSESEKETLALVNGLFGSVLFMSDDASLYDERKMELYKKVISLRGTLKDVEIVDGQIVCRYTYKQNKEELRIAL